MADITLQPARPASFAAALDAVLDRLEVLLRSFAGDRPLDLEAALHEAWIRHMTARGSRGQALI